MQKKIGFIGTGNMGSAMIEGILSSSLVPAQNIYLFDRNQEKMKGIQNKFDVNVSPSPIDLAQTVDYIILAVKPNAYQEVLQEIGKSIPKETTLISIVAGQKLDKIASFLTPQTKVVRAMPNTPALVQEGMTALTPNSFVKEEEKEEIQAIFESFGQCAFVKEEMMDAVTAVSGSAPAYVYMMIEAMADGAVMEGMPRNMAYTFAAQAILGSAKMVLKTQKHPGELKDAVCSPGGTTIAAVAVLEKKGFRSSLISAMKKCAEKSRDLSA